MGTGQLFNGDYSTGDVRFGGVGSFGFALTPSFFLETKFGAGQLNVKKYK